METKHKKKKLIHYNKMKNNFMISFLMTNINLFFIHRRNKNYCKEHIGC